MKALKCPSLLGNTGPLTLVRIFRGTYFPSGVEEKFCLSKAPTVTGISTLLLLQKSYQWNAAICWASVRKLEAYILAKRCVIEQTGFWAANTNMLHLPLHDKKRGLRRSGNEVDIVVKDTPLHILLCHFYVFEILFTAADGNCCHLVFQPQNDRIRRLSFRVYVERWTKRWPCFAKQQPSKIRQNFLAT